MGRSRDPRRRWTSTGLTVDVSGRYEAPPVDPGQGVHLWTIIAMWQVVPGSDSIHMDRENLLTIQGPGCFKCERTWTQDLGDQPCPGGMR